MELLAARFCGYWAFKMYKAKKSKPQKENQLSSECKDTFRKSDLQTGGWLFCRIAIGLPCAVPRMLATGRYHWLLVPSVLTLLKYSFFSRKNKLRTSYLVRHFADLLVEQGSKVRLSHTVMHTDPLVLILLLIVLWSLFYRDIISHQTDMQHCSCCESPRTQKITEPLRLTIKRLEHEGVRLH